MQNLALRSNGLWQTTQYFIVGGAPSGSLDRFARPVLAEMLNHGPMVMAW
jgi:hypothetical protein